MKNLVWADSFLQTLLTALKTGAVAPDFNTCTVDLFSNNRVPQRADAAGDYTVCNFTGYAQVTITSTGPYPDSVYGPYDSTQLMTFQAGSPVTVPDTAYGLFIRTAGGALVGAMRFDTPVPFTAALAVLQIAVQLRIRDYNS